MSELSLDTYDTTHTRERNHSEFLAKGLAYTISVDLRNNDLLLRMGESVRELLVRRSELLWYKLDHGIHPNTGVNYIPCNDYPKVRSWGIRTSISLCDTHTVMSGLTILPERASPFQ